MSVIAIDSGKGTKETHKFSAVFLSVWLVNDNDNDKDNDKDCSFNDESRTV